MPSLVDTLKSTVFHGRRLPLPSCTLRGLQAWRRKCCTSTAVPTAPSPASKSGLMALSSAFFIIRIIAGVASTCGNKASLNRSARCSGYTRNVWRPNVLVAAGKAANLVGERRHCQLRYRLRSRANLRSRSRSAVGGYAVSVKAEPVEENKESGIILDLTGRGHRLNNRAAILQS